MPDSPQNPNTPEATDGSPADEKPREQLEDLEVSKEEADRLRGGATAGSTEDGPSGSTTL